MWLFFVFIAIPLIEIGLFIQVGGWLGLWPTLLIVVVTAIAGTALVKSQGAQALAQLKNSFDDLRDPTEPLAHGAMILFSGALLLTPGFFTDFVGFALLVPAVRRFVLKKIKERVTVQTVRTDRGWQPQDETIIEGTYVSDENDQPSGPSGWRRD
ncbi:FxsA family protein [Rhodobacteraceae bacterium N5(2021)]|uniref:FxsA family protein n=1 Tax=Gymnodinialimonas phycosphaerae TaxID=2841589 RepID=A0A975TSZ4_9RHOB|nr:FxsA family protein [Gymnodinialimonas phycosphaerae]MBY4894263.1 FxsA family protein [Gymnodinialimonas phycosphaerae]